MQKEKLKQMSVELLIADDISKVLKVFFHNSKLKLVSYGEDTEDFQITVDDKFEMSFSISPKEKTLYIFDFRVKDGDNGTGKIIIEGFIKLLKRKNFNKIVVDTIVSDAHAWSFWVGKENCNFTKIGQNTAEKNL